MHRNISIKPCQQMVNDQGVPALRQSEIEAVVKIEALVQPVDPWDQQSISTLLENPINQLLIATINDKVVGYCLYQLLFDQAEIFRIGTHPDYQRQGIACQLIEALKRRLAEVSGTSILLEVRADNTPAIGLYDRQGFNTIHTRVGYYQAPNQPAVDALIKQWVLTSGNN